MTNPETTLKQAEDIFTCTLPESMLSSMERDLAHSGQIDHRHLGQKVLLAYRDSAAATKTLIDGIIADHSDNFDDIQTLVVPFGLSPGIPGVNPEGRSWLCFIGGDTERVTIKSDHLIREANAILTHLPSQIRSL